MNHRSVGVFTGYFGPIRDVCRRTVNNTLLAFVTSRLDYCNALLANFTVAVRQRLQRIQNSDVRLICSQPVYTRATPLLRNLNWLPVEKRIMYKLCLLMFDVQYGSTPVYRAELCSACTDERLRSRDFVIPRMRTCTADSAFMVAVLSAWNALPPELRTITSNTIFHKHLKAHLFFYLNYPLSTKSNDVNIVTLNLVFNIFNGFNLQSTNYFINTIVLLM